ncbi:hypothetical protein FOZ63_008734 [Perkinsus olseni]|uniref:Uncharacterized protein n=1 Tax=Perkinsus olseni TaxID=32597 RepID=A0A7J6R5Z2_PEROL|nr:hypothetical protein FOZ63_008734 [Perkinsus olseni]
MGRMPEVLLRLARKPSTQDSTASALYWPIGLKMPSEASPHEPWEMTAEEYWDRLKIGVFLNHRELMMALAKMLQIDDVVKQDLPAGSMFIFEVYSDEDSDESSMKMKFWRPTQPTPQEKYRGGYVDGDLLDHYGLGSATEIRPKICEGKAKCMWSDYRQALQRWTRRTGTWEEICHAKATPFGPPEDTLVNDDDDDDVFMSPHDHALHSILFGSSTARSSAVQDSHHPAAAVADFDTVLA